MANAPMNAADLGEYWRRRGVYPEQVRDWREACERARDWANDWVND